MILSKKYDIIHDIMYDIEKTMISYSISYLIYIIPDPFLALFSWLISYTFHTFLHMISVLRDIIPVIAYDICL